MEHHVSDSVLIPTLFMLTGGVGGTQYSKAYGACSVNTRLEADRPRPTAFVDSQGWQVGLTGRLMPPDAGLCEFSIEIAHTECHIPIAVPRTRVSHGGKEE